MRLSLGSVVVRNEHFLRLLELGLLEVVEALELCLQVPLPARHGRLLSFDHVRHIARVLLDRVAGLLHLLLGDLQVLEVLQSLVGSKQTLLGSRRRHGSALLVDSEGSAQGTVDLVRLLDRNHALRGRVGSLLLIVKLQ